MSDFDKLNALNSMPMATQIVGGSDKTKLLLTVTEAASLLSLGRSKTYELVRAGVIPSASPAPGESRSPTCWSMWPHSARLPDGNVA